MKTFKLGSIVLATHQGLGYLAKDFYDNGVIDNVYVHPHGSRENHYDWYPDRYKSYDEMLDDIDVLLMFETPFDWKVIPKAREKGVKTILVVNYECTNYPLPYFPDEIWCPSDLDMDVYTKLYPDAIIAGNGQEITV